MNRHFSRLIVGIERLWELSSFLKHNSMIPWKCWWYKRHFTFIFMVLVNGKCTYLFRYCSHMSEKDKTVLSGKCEASATQTDCIDWPAEGLVQSLSNKFPTPLTLWLMIHMCFHCHTLWIIQQALDYKLGLRQTSRFVWIPVYQIPPQPIASKIQLHSLTICYYFSSSSLTEAQLILK